MMRNILVPIDFTQNSGISLRFANQMSELLNSNLTILGKSAEVDSNLPGFKRRPNTKEKEVIASYNLTIDYNTWVIHNQHIEDALTDFSKLEHTELIIIGGNPFGTEPHFFDPAPLRRVINRVKCPVIIISKEIDLKTFSDITLFLPLISDERYSNVGTLKRLSDALDTKIHLLTVVDPLITSNFKVIKQLESYAVAYQLKDYSINTTYNPNIYDGLEFFNHKKNPDMTAITWGKNSRYIMLKAFIKLLEQNESAVYCIL